MSEELERLLRDELAGRADAAPSSHNDGLADAAIAGAARIRRRRRVGAASGGLGLVVFGAAVALWLPSTGGELNEAPPVATTADEAQTELDIEFVVEREGSYGLVNADDEYVPLSVENPPTRVEQLRNAYVTSSEGRVDVTALDGTDSFGYDVSAEFFSTVIRSDAEAFAVNYFPEETERQRYDLMPGDAESAAESMIPEMLDLSPELTLEDWNENLLVFSAGLHSTTGGNPGTYYFNEQHEWGLESVAMAGYESVVVADYSNPFYVCVSDLEPDGSVSDAEECGNLGDGTIEPDIEQASGDENASGLVTEVAETFFQEGLEDEIAGEDGARDQLLNSDHQFIDPYGRWQIAFSSGDETWALLDTTGEEAFVSDLRPPEGALLPVVSYQ